MINKILNRISILFIMLFILYINTFLIGIMYDSQHNLKEYTYQHNKNTYDVNNNDLCDIFNCIAITDNNTKHIFDKGVMVYEYKCRCNYINIVNDYYIDIDNASLIIKVDDRLVYLDLYDYISKQLVMIQFTLPSIIIILIYFIVDILRTEHTENIIRAAGNEAILTNKTMAIMTENIHHELNTPLEVIDNKIEKIHRVIQEQIQYNSNRKSDRVIGTLERDFEYIRTSSEQIFSVLEKMKGFKHVRYSNGDKTLHDIFKSSFETIEINQSNFTYDIGWELSGYSLKNSNLKNVDLLNIILNHIKNSLEANSTKIIVRFHNISKNTIRVRIIDNGNGIPDECKKDIFKANFTTKDDEYSTRGNGMYLNKYLLNRVGGNVILVESSIKGTTIELSIPVDKRS